MLTVPQKITGYREFTVPVKQYYYSLHPCPRRIYLGPGHLWQALDYWTLNKLGIKDNGVELIGMVSLAFCK